MLPCRFPNLLCNGTTGIAVGMASNIPPHNIKETIDAVVKMINNRIDENRDTEIEELMSVIQGPDFPTGADTEEIAIYLMALMKPEDIVLLKGSNGMKLSEVVNILTN